MSGGGPQGNRDDDREGKEGEVVSLATGSVEGREIVGGGSGMLVSVGMIGALRSLVIAGRKQVAL